MQLPNTLKTPSFVQTLQWLTNPVEFLEKAARQYPDIFSGNFDGHTCVIVHNPQAIEEIFTNKKKNFTLCDNKAVETLLGKYSIVSLTGEDHKRQRQLLMPSFHGERIRSYGQIILHLSEQIISQLPHNQPFSARTVFQELTLQVILKAVFGLYDPERYQKLKQLLVLMLNSFGSPFYTSFLFIPFLKKDFGAWSPWGKFIRLRQLIDELFDAEIAERRTHPNSERTDVLSLLMEVKDEDGQPMTNQELRDELITLLIGGYDTTASAMAWGLYWTHYEPQVGDKLRQELDTLGDSPDPMSIFRLPYLTAVCNETLRICPILPMTNALVVREPVELLGLWLERGTRVSGCIYLTHHREDLYPQHNQFQPNRFLTRQYSPYEFLPFGGGVRRCLGEALAMFEMKLVLAHILSQYQLVLAETEPERPRLQNIVFAPANGVKMMITGQRTPQRSKQPIATNTAWPN